MFTPIVFDAIAQKVLTPEQQCLKPLLEEFSETHILVGGTAIALHIGHRKSIDFDFFCFGPQGTGKELGKRIATTKLTIDKEAFFPYLSIEEESEVEFSIQGVKVQLIDFSRNPHQIPITIVASNRICQGIPTPSLLDLASLKLYAMMYRKKWKDAVDLYFLLTSQLFSFSEIVQRTEQLFFSLFKVEGSIERILENNWDKTERVEYLIESPPTDEMVEQYLLQTVKNYLKNA